MEALEERGPVAVEAAREDVVVGSLDDRDRVELDEAQALDDPVDGGLGRGARRVVEEARALEEEGAGRRDRQLGGQVTLSPALGPSSNVQTFTPGSSPAARTMPSERPNFICRGFRFAMTTTFLPRSAAGSG